MVPVQLHLVGHLCQVDLELVFAGVQALEWNAKRVRFCIMIHNKEKWWSSYHWEWFIFTYFERTATVIIQ